MPTKPKISLNCLNFTGSFAGKTKLLTRAQFILLYHIINTNGVLIPTDGFPYIAKDAVRVHFSKLKTLLNLPKNSVICEDELGYKTNREFFNWEITGLPNKGTEVA